MSSNTYWEPQDAIAREKKISVGMAPQVKDRSYHYVDETDDASAKPSKAETTTHLKWQKSQQDENNGNRNKNKMFCCSLM